jgi:NADH dehydrogenase [ubiquinone] 1 alpha subcomplex assembly factor 6
MLNRNILVKLGHNLASNLVFKYKSLNSFKCNNHMLHNYAKKYFWFSKKHENKNEQISADSQNSNSTQSKNSESNSSNDNASQTEEQPKNSIFNLNESYKYVEENVKKFDYYAHFIGTGLPPNLKNHYFAYHAFYTEIQKARYISKEASICRMRLSFWEESLKEILQDKKIKEPILICLKDTLQSTGIRKTTLFRIIDFQYFDIERSGAINSIEELEIFAENTRSLLIYMTLNLLQIDNRDAYIAASHIGRGVGIVDVLKKMPALMKIHVNQIPSDIVYKYGASMITLWDRHGQIKDQFYDCILEIAAYAKKHIEIGRTYKDKLPKNSHIAFLQAVEAYDWLLELEQYNFDVFEPRLAKISSRAIPKKMIEFGKKGEY